MYPFMQQLALVTRLEILRYACITEIYQCYNKGWVCHISRLNIMFTFILMDFLVSILENTHHLLSNMEESLLFFTVVVNNHRIYSTVIQSEITLFQVGKQFDALIVDTSAPVFDTVASDTTNVSTLGFEINSFISRCFCHKLCVCVCLCE